MKICVICEYFHPDSTGGSGTVITELSRYLRDHYDDLKIDVITSKNIYRGEVGRLPMMENWNGIRIFRLKTPKSNRSSTLLRLLAGFVFSVATLTKLLLHPRYDLILVVTNPPSVALAPYLLNKLRGTPYLYLIHDLYPNIAVALGAVHEESRAVKILAACQKKWLHGAERVIAIGRCMREIIVKQYEVPPEKIEVITNWTAIERFEPQAQSEFRARHNLQGIVVMYAGNFGQYVPFDDILDAAALLGQTHPEICFVLVGDGPRRGYILGRVAAEKLANVQVFPLVPQSEYPDLIAGANISLVALEKRIVGLGVPSKFYNILASGRPVVALVTPHSEVAYVLQDEDCGAQVEHGEPAQLARVVAEMASSPERLAVLSHNARRACEKEFTLPKVATRFREIFDKCAAENLTKAE